MTQLIFNNLIGDIDDNHVPWDDLVQEDYHVKVYRDKYPVTPGHLLYVPVYNTISVLMNAVEDAVRFGKSQVTNGTWDGFNIGINYGKAAGQTVNWPHVHLIPRRKGDVEDPIGGIRNVIPGMGNYHK